MFVNSSIPYLESSRPIPLCRTPPNGIRGSETTTLLTVTSPDRKSTRLNSSHSQISYAVFCLKKKKKYALISHITLYIVIREVLFLLVIALQNVNSYYTSLESLSYPNTSTRLIPLFL